MPVVVEQGEARGRLIQCARCLVRKQEARPARAARISALNVNILEYMTGSTYF